MKTAARLKLTALNLDSLPPGDYTDHLVPNLVFRPGKKRKPWVVRSSALKEGRKIIGYYLGRNVLADDNMGLASAREMARKALEKIDAGAPLVDKPSHPNTAARRSARSSMPTRRRGERKAARASRRSTPRCARCATTSTPT